MFSRVYLGYSENIIIVETMKRAFLTFFTLDSKVQENTTNVRMD